MKTRTVYICEVCQFEYATQEATRICETSDNHPPPVKIGDEVKLKNRNGLTYTVTTISQLYLGNKGGLSGLSCEDIEGTILAGVSGAMPLHTWIARVDPPVYLDHKWDRPAADIVLETYLLQEAEVKRMARHDNWGYP